MVVLQAMLMLSMLVNACLVMEVMRQVERRRESVRVEKMIRQAERTGR